MTLSSGSPTLLIDEEKQRLFAQLSGDHNPMHIDPVYSLRLMYGQPVVHGMHLLLITLEAGLKDISGKWRLENLTCRFFNPTFIQAEFKVHLHQNNEGVVFFEGKSENSILFSGEFKLMTIAPEVPLSDVIVEHQNPPFSRPLEFADSDASLFEESLTLTFNRLTAESLFPHIINKLIHADLALILACTRTIGMKCPGLHSIFAGISLSRNQDSALMQSKPDANFKCSHYDERFGLINLRVISSQLTGDLTAFFRPKPVNQISYKQCLNLVIHNEFESTNAIVIGGSRGIGEATSKLLSAGGGNVLLTYRASKTEAFRIKEELAQSEGEIHPFQFDVSSKDFEALTKQIERYRPSHLFYFASPKIVPGTLSNVSTARINELMSCYVYDFIRVTQKLIELGVRTVMYPSSSFLDELPPNFPEYIISKACGEAAVKLLQESNKHVKFWAPRIPKLATDQTSEFNNSHLKRAEDIMMPILREMNIDI